MAQGFKQIKNVSVTYASDAAGTLDIYTDWTGILGFVSSHPLPSTGGLGATSRVKKTIDLQASYSPFKQIKFKATPGANGRIIMYEGSVEVRQIGTYLEGANGDIWETQPLSLGA